MEAFQKRQRTACFYLPKFVFRCVGISVNDNESFKYKCFSIVAIIVAYLYPWGCLHVALNSNGDFDVFCNALFSMLGGITANCELFVILVNRTRLRKIFENLGKVQKAYNTNEWSQKLVLSANKKILWTVILVYLAFSLCFVATMAQRIIVSDRSKWRTPISDLYVINITYSPNFEIAWSYQVFSVMVVGSCYYVTALLIAAVTVDLTVQFKIFRNDIKERFTEAVNSLIKGDSEDCVQKNWLLLNGAVKEIVIRHLTLMNLVSEVEKVFSYLIIMDVMGSLGSVCFGLYYSSILPPFSTTSVQSYFVVTVIILTLFAICYCGNELSQAGKAIDSACYEVDFVGTDLRFQKSLLIIIARSQEPIRLTVGGFADLSLPIFAWILKSTYTYFMVLRESSEVLVTE